MKKLFGDPKTRIRNMLLLMLPFFILIFVFGFITWKSATKVAIGISGEPVVEEKEPEKQQVNKMDYHLRGDATEFQKQLFDELNKAISDGVDDSEIARLVAENFVADFYTWTNKEGIYDIGGAYYLFSPVRNLVISQARNTFYKYLNYYQDEFGKDDLLEVVSITSEKSEEFAHEYEGKTYPAYFVTVRWDYKPCNNFPVERYITKSFFTVVNNNGRFEIAEAYGDE